MKKFVPIILVTLLLLFTLTSAVEAKEIKSVPVPETIINKNVPPIPAAIKEKYDLYSKLEPTIFEGIVPGSNTMVVSHRLGLSSQLHLLEKPMGKLVPLTQYKEPVRGTLFPEDPSKKFFLFMKDVGGAENYQIYRFDMKTKKATMISDGKSRYMGILFNHKNDKVAFTSNKRAGRFFDIYVMDPMNPKEEKLVYKAERSAYNIAAGWLHDDRHLLMVEYISANKANTLVIDTVSGTVENITPPSDNPLVFTMGAASKDGRYLYGTTDKDMEFTKLVRFDRETKKIKVITNDIPWNVSGAILSRDGKKGVFTSNEDGITRAYLMDMETLKYKRLDAIPTGLLFGLHFGPKGKRLFMSMNTPQTVGDTYELDLATMKMTRWTQVDAGSLDVSKFVIPKLIHYPTFDKVDGKPRMLPAFYYRPTKKTGKPCPVLIDIHGGPEGQYRPAFRLFSSFLVEEMGIAVLAPNVRGSAGYGKSYLLMDNWEKREDSVKDIGTLLDWIEKQPELDKDRVAVFGGSYGGYMVLASMFHFNDRLACGVDIVGISNFVTFLKNTSAYRRDLRRAEYGDERKIGEFLNKISPTTNAHKIKKPLFVIQGKNDPRVPASEAAQIVETVEKNKVPVWYQLATNEGHGFSKKDNRDFMNYSVIKFLKEHLIK